MMPVWVVIFWIFGAVVMLTLDSGSQGIFGKHAAENNKQTHDHAVSPPQELMFVSLPNVSALSHFAFAEDPLPICMNATG